MFPVLPHKVGVQWAFIGLRKAVPMLGLAAHIAPDLHILEEELITEGALAETQVTCFLERKRLFVNNKKACPQQALA